MSAATETWHEENGRRLAAAVADVRARLERYVEKSAPPRPTEAPPATPSAPASDKVVSRSFIQRLLSEPGKGPAAIPDPEPAAAPESPADTPVDASAGAAADPNPQAGPVESPTALEMLSKQLGLSVFEQQVLLLCAAVEFDTRIAGLCARAHDDPQKPYPTFALALALFDQPSWDVLSPERPLRFWRLLEINQTGAQSLTMSGLRADERIVNYLKGLTYLDDRIASYLTPFDLEGGPIALAPSQEQVADSILRQLQQSVDVGRLPVVQLVGPDPIAKQLVAHDVASALPHRLCRIAVDLLPPAAADLEALGRLWVRESRLLPLALYLDADELDAASERAAVMRRFLSRTDSVCFVAVREIVPRVGRHSIVVDVAKPQADEQQSAWTAALGDAAAGAAPGLAAQFNLNLSTIDRLAKLAAADTAPATPLPDRVWDVCCASERPRLDALAERLRPTATWDDLVLPATEMTLLRQVAAQVAQRNRVYQAWGFARKMNRGFGISTLFAGPSGTGKTMAAEVIAAALRLNLYRIDLSAVVNKYIGETEKNLRRLFDAAEDSGAILCFDEADALFGKRSEVKDSHDRYANIEVNYLLQRIESYRGLAILTSNMKAALDSAFTRRLRFIVNFPFPTAADRRRLWERAFLQDDVRHGLPAPPLGALDYDRLARLNLAGGQIHNVALNAAFLAAHAGSPVSMAMILDAARAEFVKTDRPINEADFRWAEPSRDVLASPAAASATVPA